MASSAPRKIAFIVDCKAEPKALIRYVLSSARDRQDEWHVWNPRAQSSRAQGRSQIEYAQTLFVVLSHAVHTAASALPSTRGPQRASRAVAPVRIDKTDKAHWRWASRLFNVIQAPDRYRAIPEELRRGLSPLLMARSKRGEHDARIEVTTGGSHTVYFWDAGSEVLASTHLDRHVEDGTLLSLRPTVPTSVDIQLVYALSSEIPLPHQHETWQDLYRRATTTLEYVSSPRWIAPTGLRVQAASGDSSVLQPVQVGTDSPPQTLVPVGQSMGLHEMLRRHKNLLITGVSGSGKTTALRLLTHSLLLPKSQHFPIYVRIKEMEPLLIRLLERRGEIDIAEVVGESVARILLRELDPAKPANLPIIENLIRRSGPRSKRRPSSRGSIFTALAAEISRWFRQAAVGNPDVVLMLDGINELRYGVRTALIREISRLVCRPCKLVLACRSNIVHELLRPFSDSVACYELESPSEADIVAYLDHFVPGRGEQIFLDQIQNNPSLLAMAHNPFFLSLLAFVASRDNRAILPPNRAQLVQGFVFDCMGRKQREANLAVPDLADNVMYAVLPAIAKWCIESVASDTSISLASLWSSGQSKGHGIAATEFFACLEAAEAYGLLRFSGLLKESYERFGYPEFLHDYVRDYFGAKYLLGYVKLSDVPGLRDILEHFEWDGALRMYCGLLRDANAFKDVVTTIATFDPFLAASTFQWTDLKAEDAFASLLATFTDERFKKLSSSPASNTCFGVKYAITNMLSSCDTQELLRMHADPASDVLVRQAIPRALYMNLGTGALDSLKALKEAATPELDLDRLSAIAAVGTSASWEYLSQQYIDLVKAQDPQRHVLQLVLTHEHLRPDLDTIVRILDRAKQTLHIPAGYEHIHEAAVVLSAPIERLAARHADTLVGLLDSPNKAIADAARSGLRKQLHPVVIGKLLEWLWDDSCCILPLPTVADDMETLAGLNDREVDSRLWWLFQRSFQESVEHPNLSVIPRKLAHRADDTVMRNALLQVIDSDSDAAAVCINAFVAADPHRTRQVVATNMPDKKRRQKYWHRHIVISGLCGDPSVKDDLLGILSEVESIPWVSKTRPFGKDGKYTISNIPLALWAFQSLVFDAVRRLKIIAAKPILQKLIERSTDDAIRVHANDTKTYLTFVQIDSLDAASELGSLITHTSSGTGRDVWYFRVAAWWPDWSDDTRVRFLSALVAYTEWTLRGDLQGSAGFLYGLAATCRIAARRRYMDLFTGWPLRPLEVVEEPATSEQRRPGARRRSKRRRP